MNSQLFLDKKYGEKYTDNSFSRGRQILSDVNIQLSDVSFLSSCIYRISMPLGISFSYGLVAMNLSRGDIIFLKGRFAS